MKLLFTLIAALGCATALAQRPAPMSTPAEKLFGADNKNLQYIGRVDLANPKRPRFWSPGVYLTARFTGPGCTLLINDEAAGKNHNYLHLVVDGKMSRIKLTDKANTVVVATGLRNGPHTLTICKDTESGIGYLEMVGLKCAGLLPPLPLPTRKIEFIGNSITCGMGADASVVPCKTAEWFDQHNAYQAYGPTTARALQAQYYLTAVSGIGLIHSCCDMTVTMPEVFGSLNLRDGTGRWDVARYQPDVVTVTLGQNDGIQDSVKFCRAYVAFLGTLRKAYPAAQLVCLTSPMGNAPLTAVLKRYLTGVVAAANAAGDARVHKFFFSRSYNAGCDAHPSLAEHQLIARELTPYLKKLMSW